MWIDHHTEILKANVSSVSHLWNTRNDSFFNLCAVVNNYLHYQLCWWHQIFLFHWLPLMHQPPLMICCLAIKRYFHLLILKVKKAISLTSDNCKAHPDKYDSNNSWVKKWNEDILICFLCSPIFLSRPLRNKYAKQWLNGRPGLFLQVLSWMWLDLSMSKGLSKRTTFKFQTIHLYTLPYCSPTFKEIEQRK